MHHHLHHQPLLHYTGERIHRQTLRCSGCLSSSSSLLYYILPYSTILYSTLLYYTILYCTVLQEHEAIYHYTDIPLSLLSSRYPYTHSTLHYSTVVMSSSSVSSIEIAYWLHFKQHVRTFHCRSYKGDFDSMKRSGTFVRWHTSLPSQPSQPAHVINTLLYCTMLYGTIYQSILFYSQCNR